MTISDNRRSDQSEERHVASIPLDSRNYTDTHGHNNTETVGADGEHQSAECETLLDAEDKRSTKRECDHDDTEVEIEDTNTKNDSNNIKKAKAPDGGWGWFIVLGCLILRMMIGGIGRSHGILYIKFKDRFNGSATSTALITSLTGFVRLSLGPVVSILTNRVSCRVLTAIGAFFLSLGLILSSFAPSQGFLYFSYGVTCGLGRAFALTPAPIILGYYFDKRRSLAYGLASAGFSLGGFAISPLVEVLFQTFGFQGAFLVLAGTAMHVFVSSTLFRPLHVHNSLTRTKGKSNENRELLIKNTTETAKTANDSKLSLRDKQPETVNAESNNGISTSTNEQGNIATEINNETSCSDVNQGDKKSSRCCLCIPVKRGDLSQTSAKETEAGHKNKRKWISLSILKDVRFVCFVLATVCFTLPNTLLFLPSLAISRGVSEINAAYLLSAMAGVDTVTRVISGFVLDFKVFRKIRPEIFCGVTFAHSVAESLVPSMTSLGEFMLMSVIVGILTGVRSAQGSVILLDILGVDKLASSLAITMAAQGFSVFLGPTISGQLKDIYGTYDGAFYFASAALFAGASIMTAGQIRKYWVDRRATKASRDQKTESEQEQQTETSREQRKPSQQNS